MQTEYEYGRKNNVSKRVRHIVSKSFLQQSCGIDNPLMVQSLEKVRCNEILISARVIGAGLHQLARLTGVSFGVVQKCCKD